jgi:hypothetical protein
LDRLHLRVRAGALRPFEVDSVRSGEAGAIHDEWSKGSNRVYACFGVCQQVLLGQDCNAMKKIAHSHGLTTLPLCRYRDSFNCPAAVGNGLSRNLG